MPRHVAIIMDGNGRWAAARGLPRVEGHRRGVEALRRTVRAAGEIGIKYLTIFSFSSENWSRPAAEDRRTDGPAAPLHPQRSRRAAPEQRARAHHRRARRARSPTSARLLDEAEELTSDNDGLRWSSRSTTAPARRSRARRAAWPRRSRRASSSRDDIDVENGRQRVSTRRILPDPDLIIRTSGEQRLSNFLLWQAAYSELVFVPTYWPDFDRAALEGAIAEYRRRERRFGGLVAKTGS